MIATTTIIIPQVIQAITSQVIQAIIQAITQTITINKKLITTKNKNIIMNFHFIIQLETFNFFNSINGKQYMISAVASFLMAVLIPLLLYELVSKNIILRKIFC